MLFRILPNIYHSLYGKLNKSTKFLQVPPRKFENLISGAPNISRGWKNFFKRINGGDAYLRPKSRVVDPVLLLLLLLL